VAALGCLIRGGQTIFSRAPNFSRSTNSDVARHGLGPQTKNVAPPQRNEALLALGLCFLHDLCQKMNTFCYISLVERARCRWKKKILRNILAQTSAKISPTPQPQNPGYVPEYKLEAIINCS